MHVDFLDGKAYNAIVTKTSRLERKKTMEKVSKVKTAVVGCGMISNIYLRNLKNLFYIIDLVAVCDLNQASAEEKAKTYGIERVMTIDEVASSKDIELVINLTGPVAHYDVIKKMLEAGKHVFTEKTMTAELWQAQELVALAEKKHLYLGCAPDTVLGAGIQTARQIIDAGFIGDVTSCMVSVNRNQNLNSETYRFLRNKGGALPNDVGIYYVQSLLTLLGPVKALCGFGAPALLHKAELLFQSEPEEQWRIPGNNVLAGCLEFENGAIGSLHFNGNTTNATKNVFNIFGTQGYLELGDPNTFGGEVVLVRDGGEPCRIPLTHGYDGKPTLPNPTQFEYAYGHRGVGVAEMAWAIRTGRPNRCSKEMGLHAQEVLCGLDASAASGMKYSMQSTFQKPAVLKPGYMSSGFGGAARADAERSLME